MCPSSVLEVEGEGKDFIKNWVFHVILANNLCAGQTGAEEKPGLVREQQQWGKPVPPRDKDLLG